jgi:thioredoxin-like negative regulator of GroEL
LRCTVVGRVLVLLAVVVALGAGPGGEALFRSDPTTAFRLAGESERPLLIEFHTTWCEACERMRKTTWLDDRVVKLVDRFIALSVDGDRNANLVSRYDVTAYPTIVFAEPGGQPILVLLGYQNAGAMRERLAAVLDQWDDLRDWAVDAADRRPEAAAALVHLGDFALAGGAHAHAERCYRKALRQGESSPAEFSLRARVGLVEVLAATGRCREAARMVNRAGKDQADNLAARTEHIFGEPNGSCSQQP